MNYLKSDENHQYHAFIADEHNIGAPPPRRSNYDAVQLCIVPILR